MKFAEYIQKENKTIAGVARDLGLTHCVVRVWVAGEKIPSKENMQKIVAYTKGAVTPNDFYDGVE